MANGTSKILALANFSSDIEISTAFTKSLKVSFILHLFRYEVLRLASAKLSPNVTHSNSAPPSGSFRCGKNCASTCPYIFHGLTNYTFFSTGETRSINSHIICETKTLIYMIQCNRCHEQYIEETKRRLKDRFNEHRRTLDNANIKSKPTTVAEHFLSSPHNISKDMLLIPIEKIFSNRDSIRKAREAFLISKGRTIDPNGLNIREETY